MAAGAATGNGQRPRADAPDVSRMVGDNHHSVLLPGRHRGHRVLRIGEFALLQGQHRGRAARFENGPDMVYRIDSGRHSLVNTLSPPLPFARIIGKAALTSYSIDNCGYRPSGGLCPF